VDVRNGHDEQVLMGVAAQRAARAVGGEDLVGEGAGDEGRIAGFIEEPPESVIAMHPWLALHRAGASSAGMKPAWSPGEPGRLPEQPPAGR
jgi:hypothetical protein